MSKPVSQVIPMLQLVVEESRREVAGMCRMTRTPLGAVPEAAREAMEATHAEWVRTALVETGWTPSGLYDEVEASTSPAWARRNLRPLLSGKVLWS